MRLFRNASIKRKQMLIIMLTSSAALLLACMAFVACELITFRGEMRRILIGIGARISDAAIPCVTFDDRRCARETLNNILSDEPNIVAACIFKKDGTPFAVYRRSDQTDFFKPPPFPEMAGVHFAADRLTLARQIVLDDVIGTLYIESDLQAMNTRLIRYAGIVATVLLFSSVLAFLLSSWLQKVISDPIIHLAQIAKTVSQKRNYAIRADSQGARDDSDDELSGLICGFNEMLAQIQTRDAELEKARGELEKRIEERTRDLQLQIAERSRAEKALQQQFSRISLLNQITHSISERLDFKSVLNIVLSQLKDHLPTDFGAVFVLNSSGSFEFTAQTEFKNSTADRESKPALPNIIAPMQSGFNDCLEGNMVSLPDITALNSPLMRQFAAAGLKCVFALPLIVEEKLFGVLLVARSQANSFSSEETEFLKVLCEQVALAAHQARLHTELRSAYDEIKNTQNAVMQQQRLRALGEMASGIAHDINNALSPIIVYSELLLRNEKSITESSKRHLENIKTAGEDIAHIVARMREFYRRREGNDELLAIDLNRLAGQVVELTRPRWRDIPQQKGFVVEMKTELDASNPEIYGNATELREALTNLILNAVDAMPAGGKLTIRTLANPSEHAGWNKKTCGRVALEICDTGIGMNDETRSRCVEPFFSTKGQRGTGLGLAMVYGIMERHEGSIEIESEPGKGTTIRLIFARREKDPAQPSAHGSTIRVPPMRILCIDDEPLLRQLMREILESDGHFVSTADSGQSGIDTFRCAIEKREPFDIVITDLGMPYLDGRQVACLLKKESAGTPVILLTGWGTMMKADGELPAQVDAVVSKPPRISELRETLLKVISSPS